MVDLKDKKVGDVVVFPIERDANFRYMMVDDASASTGMVGQVEINLISYQSKFETQAFDVVKKDEAGAAIGNPKVSTSLSAVELATLRFAPEKAMAVAGILVEIALKLGGNPEPVIERLKNHLTLPAQRKPRVKSAAKAIVAGTP